MPHNTQNAPASNRFYFLDNLRTVMIFLVVLYHVGGVYESAGIWEDFWLVDDPDTTELSGLLNIILDIFIMPPLFFISGYLAPVSLNKKGVWGFVKSKFRRLMISWLVAVFTLIPLYRVIFLYSRDLPREKWLDYFHFSNTITETSQNWLWFLPVLFLFTILYALFARFNWVPMQLSFKKALMAVLGISFISSLSLDLMGGWGEWTLTPLLDFQNERIVMYFLVFLLGSVAYYQEIFAGTPERFMLYRIAKYTFWIPLLSYVVFLVGRVVAEDEGREAFIAHGLDEAGYWLSFYLTLSVIVYLLIVYFWRHLNTPGNLWKELNQNSYNVYLIHVVVLGVIALLLLNIALPGPVKYIILMTSTYIVCNVLVSVYRRITSSQRITPQVA